MEIYSFDQNQMLDTYNRLKNKLLAESDENKKIQIYSELVSFKNIIEIKENLRPLKPKHYDKFAQSEINKRNKIFKDIDSLSSELSIYWNNNLEDINLDIFYYNYIRNNFNSKEEFYTKLSSFFAEVFPEEIKLFENTFQEQKILIKKSKNISAKTIFLSSLADYYIRINFRNHLNIHALEYTIHEFGHASEFCENHHGTSYDDLMEEVVATVYELLFIDYYFQKNNWQKLSEFNNLFTTISTIPLKNYYHSSNSMQFLLPSSIFSDRLNFMYTNIIATAIYLRRNESSFKKQLKYIKENKPYLPTFKLLENLGIDDNELIYTAKNMKKLILER